MEQFGKMAAEKQNKITICSKDMERPRVQGTTVSLECEDVSVSKDVLEANLPLSQRRL